jgi:hypothetical protein
VRNPPGSPKPVAADLIRRRRQRLEEFESKAEPVVPKLLIGRSQDVEAEIVEESAAKTREWADAVRAEQREKWKMENSGDEEDDGQWMADWRAKKAQAKAAFEAMLRKDEEEFAAKHARYSQLLAVRVYQAFVHHRFL